MPARRGRKTVDVIVPAFNEEDCVEELVRRLIAVFDAERDYQWRALIVENGSSDRTWDLLQIAATQDKRICVIRLSRNFRMDGGLTAGLDFATADAVVFMTADLQDPPEAIPEFLRAWEAGADNVYGLVTKREGTGLIRRMNSQLFYWVANRMTGGLMPRNASDFRLMDRRLYETLRDLDERNRFMRGLVAWAGFTTVAVPVPRPPRFAGESKAYSLPVVGLAARALLAHSYLPLHLIAIFGIVLSGLSVLAILVLFPIWIARGVPFAGFGSIVALGLLSLGLITLILGVIAEYISLIYEEVKRRPNFVVRETVGITHP
jgi:dolichol-phosphate mannosyltransferase